jgi:hypothetical protein
MAEALCSDYGEPHALSAFHPLHPLEQQFMPPPRLLPPPGPSIAAAPQAYPRSAPSTEMGRERRCENSSCWRRRTEPSCCKTSSPTSNSSGPAACKPASFLCSSLQTRSFSLQQLANPLLSFASACKPASFLCISLQTRFFPLQQLANPLLFFASACKPASFLCISLQTRFFPLHRTARCPYPCLGIPISPLLRLSAPQAVGVSAFTCPPVPPSLLNHTRPA